MTIFISWSGDESKDVARALKKWLPKIIQGLETFMSENDIPPGTRWYSEIANQLEGANYGVICVTPENQDSPWLNFEAGAIGKETGGAHVTPFATSMLRDDVSGPLGGFNSVNSDKEGFLSLIKSINASLVGGSPLEDVMDAAEAFWPAFERDLEARTLGNVPAPRFDLETAVEEIRQSVRQLARDQSEAKLESQDADAGAWRLQPPSYRPRSMGEMQAIIQQALEAIEYSQQFDVPLDAQQRSNLKRLTRLAREGDATAIAGLESVERLARSKPLDLFTVAD